MPNWAARPLGDIYRPLALAMEWGWDFGIAKLPPADPLPPHLKWFAVWRSWRGRAVILGCLLLCYVFSLGPVWWLNHRRRLPRSAPEVILIMYRPILITNESEWTAAPLNAYLDLWESLP